MDKESNKILKEILNAIKGKEKKIPISKFDKTLIYYYNYDISEWTPFKADKLTIRKLMAYYHSTTPTALTEEQEGWSPIRINSAGELIIASNADILTKNTEIDTVLDNIKTAIDAIKLQTDKLAFTGANSTLIVHETTPT